MPRTPVSAPRLHRPPVPAARCKSTPSSCRCVSAGTGMCRPSGQEAAAGPAAERVERPEGRQVANGVSPCPDPLSCEATPPAWGEEPRAAGPSGQARGGPCRAATAAPGISASPAWRRRREPASRGPPGACQRGRLLVPSAGVSAATVGVVVEARRVADWHHRRHRERLAERADRVALWILRHHDRVANRPSPMLSCAGRWPGSGSVGVSPLHWVLP
jgi:hypothetical protein